MSQLYGKSYSADQLRERVGTMDQLGGARRITLADGNEAGVEAFDLCTGGGLDCLVLAGRGMDIGAASYRGFPLAWQSSTGAPHASFFEPKGLGWLRGFHGGLVATCGLTYAGAPGPDGDENLGLHGRVSHIPAKHVSSGAGWDDDEYIMYVEGQMRESSVFGPNVVMNRRISSVLGQPLLHIEDSVTNDGFEPQEHMLLYHCNLGFPLMDENTEIITASEEIVGQTQFAEETIADHARFAPPQVVDERVYYHRLTPNEEGYATVAVVNRELAGGIALAISFSVEHLPFLAQWKMPGKGVYVLGIEPSNCHVEGRAAERERGTLQVLEPGESRSYSLVFTVAEGPNAIDRLTEDIRSLR